MASAAGVSRRDGTARSAHKLDHVQMLRAYAALAVVTYHLTAQSPNLLTHKLLSNAFGWGASGVDTFFVISGFIIMTVHRSDIGKPSAVRPYLIKRLIRIYPIYWIVTLIALPIYLFGYGDDAKRDVMLIVKSFLLYPQHPGYFPLVNVGWTLSYELVFYLMFALLIALPAVVAVPVVTAWITPCIAVTILGYAGVWHTQFNMLYLFVLSPRNVEFAMGVLVAVLVARWRMRAPAALMWGGLAALLTIGFISALDDGATTIGANPAVWYGIPSAVMLAGAAQLDHDGATAQRGLVALGDASYSLYLIHFGLITGIFELAGPLHLKAIGWLGLLNVIALACSIAGALLCFRYVETPLLRWSRQRFLTPRLTSGL